MINAGDIIVIDPEKATATRMANWAIEFAELGTLLRVLDVSDEYYDVEALGEPYRVAKHHAKLAGEADPIRKIQLESDAY